MITIENIMSKPIFLISGDATVDEVVKIMTEKGIGSVLIGKNMDAEGIITEKDLITKVLYKGLDIAKTKATDIMSSPLLQMDKHSPVPEAALKMSNSNVEHIIVTDEEGMVGLVSARDIAYFASST